MAWVAEIEEIIFTGDVRVYREKITKYSVNIIVWNSDGAFKFSIKNGRYILKFFTHSVCDRDNLIKWEAINITSREELEEQIQTEYLLGGY